MLDTTIQVKDKTVNIVSHYYKQYLNNYQSLNMEFTEFMASKLGVPEYIAARVVRKWKETKIK
jgi:hypothetical protein